MRLVVKVGTSTLVHPTGKLNIRRVEQLCRVISDLKNAGNQIVLVSSGAIGLGVAKLNLPARPDDMPGKQAAAAVGQCELMYAYDKLFTEYGHTVAQVLVTGDDMQNGERNSRFNDTVFRLLQLGVLPIINENDTVATEEIAVGDNDTLAALVAVSIQSDLLVLLSDIDGLYTADPGKDGGAQLIREVGCVDESVFALAGAAGGALGTGGMATKLKAAKICMQNGIEMMIANGAAPKILYRAAEGQNIGTRFKAN